MSFRPALFLLLFSVLAGCVSSGSSDPMKTDKGRDAARDAYIQLGIGYLQQGATERAKVPLKKALELDPSSGNANVALALVFQAEMEPELADQHFRKALAQNSKDPRYLNNYGSFLFEQGRYQDAYERYQQAAQDNLYPERSRVFENLGLTALKLNDKAQAQKYFERAVRLNKRQPRALLALAQMSFDQKHYVPARHYYDQFSQVSEQNAESLLLGARLATVFEDRDKAASLGLQLKRLYPGTPEYKQYLSEQ
ncbi:type IV pilus biogenesis/stability protein PilW [Pseudomonas sp. UL073]|uniref:Type IV pilus biogenesis/stability protein PilW n=1 Tax=Zestomonas insulae TaxID=2809017 RepID=A0ABS2IAD1_9GAMM|nr:type IV pilus biogenesis/stability protein PilW [Pseudomonas insulae]MBM7059967.1 type IV pilus biogenesis/stability protein PilW [Pseudomonas insulae]